jgi:hypothetical protein
VATWSELAQKFSRGQGLVDQGRLQAAAPIFAGIFQAFVDALLLHAQARSFVLVVLFFGFFVASVAVCSSIVCIFTFIERLPVKAAQESAASWSADDDAHEDRSEIDDQLNCVWFTLSTGTCLYLFSSYHSIAFFVICATGLHACSQQRRCSRNVHY